MTPARKAALQWFYDRGVVARPCNCSTAPTGPMVLKMLGDEQLQWTLDGYSLTDKGRRMLHGDDK
jgi:hypothetical protein